MDNRSLDFIVDQGVCYPAATDYYGYYCTGFESPGEWDDHHRFFGFGGADSLDVGMHIESSPYVYYTPGYGYSQSLYNPYNSYIPGAIIGGDGLFVGDQQYYVGSAYEHCTSPPAYFPVIFPPRIDGIPSSSLEPYLLNSSASSTIKPDGGLKKSTLAPKGMTKSSLKPNLREELASSNCNQICSLAKILEGSKANAAETYKPVAHTSITSGGAHSAPSIASQGRIVSRSTRAADKFSLGRDSSLQNTMEVYPSIANGSSEFGGIGWAPVDKLSPGLHYGGVLNNVKKSSDLLGEQRRGPRHRSKSHWTSSISVKACRTEEGACNAEGNINIYADQYNKEDFVVNYIDARFFVIKSYSEDDVYKSIKYNVWSSTPNGNMRLDSAYKDAQRIASEKQNGCPLFLFFSVNASGQFCGVAEMIGPVDFHKDMDFWQQDKWSGSFPVKWHIVKDVPNTNLWHIRLENNENRPVTYSRDTQEIRYKQGMEMLNIFKDYTLKTCILDDFIYYEDQQKIMLEEKARSLGRKYDGSFYAPAFVPPNKPNRLADRSPSAGERHINPIDRIIPAKIMTSTNKQDLIESVHNSSCNGLDTKHNVHGDAHDAAPVLKIASLTIDPKQAEAKPPAAAMPSMDTEVVDDVTAVSIPIKVNGVAETSSRTFAVGTIPIHLKH